MSEKRVLAVNLVHTFRKVSGSLKVALGTLYRWVEEFWNMGKLVRDPKGGSIGCGMERKMHQDLFSVVEGFVKRESGQHFSLRQILESHHYRLVPRAGRLHVQMCNHSALRA